MPNKLIDGGNVPPSKDKRIKLTEEQRTAIYTEHHFGGASMRGLALEYGVSRRLVSFICYPEKKEQNLKRREELGGSKAFYNKERHREYTAKHRAHKKELHAKGELILKD